MFDDVLKDAKKAKSSDKSPPPSVIVPENEIVNTRRKRKATGKRTDPAYKQVGAYIKKDTYLQIQKLLLDQPNKDFSDLVQELLSDYLSK